MEAPPDQNIGDQPRFLAPEITQQEVNTWAQNHIDDQVVSKQVQRGEDRIVRKQIDRLRYTSLTRNDGMLVIDFRNYQWFIYSCSATHTSNVVRQIVDKAPKGHPDRFVLAELDAVLGNVMPPYIVEKVVNYWHELVLNIEYNAPMVVEKAFKKPDNAPTNHDYASSCTGLMLLIYLYDCGFALDDQFLRFLAERELRDRLVKRQYTTKEFIAALEEVYTRKSTHSKNRMLKKLLLSAAITACRGYSFSTTEGKPFVELMARQPDFLMDMMKGLQWHSYKVRGVTPTRFLE